MSDGELVTSACGEGSVTEVVDRLAQAVTAAGLTVFGRIDHGANAAEVGIELRPTTLLIFGNPRVGTTLMQDQQTAGLDLPFKALVWEDEAAQVWITYADPSGLGRRHRLRERSEPVLAAIRDGMSTIVSQVAEPAPSAADAGARAGRLS